MTSTSGLFMRILLSTIYYDLACSLRMGHHSALTWHLPLPIAYFSKRLSMVRIISGVVVSALGALCLVCPPKRTRWATQD